MNKIIVIERCGYCPYSTSSLFCTHLDTFMQRCPSEGIADWCPLRPLPEKRNTTSLIETKHEAEENHVTPQHQAGFNLGWNACLEAITGGTYDETEDD